MTNRPHNLVRFDSLPLGARFQYPDRDRVYVKLENGGSGLVCDWDSPRLDAPLQGIYSFAASGAERAEGRVIWLDRDASSGGSKSIISVQEIETLYRRLLMQSGVPAETLAARRSLIEAISQDLCRRLELDVQAVTIAIKGAAALKASTEPS